MPFQTGDALNTSANVTKLKKLIGYSPKIKINEGIYNFVNWFKKYHKVK